MKDLLHRTVTAFHNMKIRRRLLLILILSIIPFVSFSYFIYLNITDKLTHSQLTLASQGYHQVKSFLDYRFEQIFLVTSVISMDSNLNGILIRDPVTYSVYEQLRDKAIVKAYLGQFQRENQNLDTLRLYLPGGFTYFPDDKLLYNMDAAKDTRWFQNTFQGWGWVTVNSPALVENNSSISIVRPIRDMKHDYSRFVGAVRIDISTQELQQILTRINVTDGCLSYLAFRNGDLASTSSLALWEKLHLNDEYLKQALLADNEFVMLDVNGEKVWAFANPLENTDLMLVTVLPNRELISEMRLIQLNYIYALAFLLVLIIAFFTPSINSLTRRIKELVDNMKFVQEGNLNVKMTAQYRDEIGMLAVDFNYMIERVIALMKEQYLLGQDLKTAELKALQAQINPHFLYNTLEMIGWMAYKSNPKEIQTMTISLAQFYRLSLNHGQDITSISNELMLIESYLHIQTSRFRNELSVQIDVTEIGAYAIPKITLQPIVENAIMHGILEKDSKSGTIKIKGRLTKNNRIELSIKDDGVGMTPSQIQKLMNMQRDANRMDGYGLQNIETRICLYFNIEKAIRIISKPGVGTKVIIAIPAIRYPAESS